MTAELLALLAALFFGLSSIFSKKGLETSDAMTAAAICVLFQVAILLVPTLILVPLDSFLNIAVLLFVLSGFLSTFAGLQFEFLAIDRAGVSVTSALTSVAPLFAAFAAVSLLAERPTAYVGIGILLTVTGVILLSYKKEAIAGWRKNGIAFGLLAAGFHGVASIPRKIALNTVSFPLLGALVETSAGLFFFGVYIAFFRKKLNSDRKSLRFFSLRSLSNGMALSLLFFALAIGEVTIVSPLSDISPLFTLVFAFAFLRKAEKITLKIAISAIIIVIGSALIVTY